ncbi:3-phosphoglycerate dehydrogenase, partial [Escherichia coli]|nr:3-phosphoglycerate dehydrogenase [Escherichia coli]
IPNMVGQITTELGKYSLNILDMINRSKNEYAYTLIDIDKETQANLEQLKSDLLAVQGVLRVRVIEPLGVTV